MVVRIANREDPDQTLIRLCTVCPGFFWQATSVQKFRSLTVCNIGSKTENFYAKIAKVMEDLSLTLFTISHWNSMIRKMCH